MHRHVGVARSRRLEAHHAVGVGRHERLPRAGVAVHRGVRERTRVGGRRRRVVLVAPRERPDIDVDRPPQDLDLGVALGAPRTGPLDVQRDADPAQRRPQRPDGYPDAEVDHEHEPR